mmetsp:Transcript_17294/g.35118  ORF Transcript_17294/g.35118 Transcript_17294/m.35118 type:complete len:111 (-) Transcript_17294:142-474(-)
MQRVCTQTATEQKRVDRLQHIHLFESTTATKKKTKLRRKRTSGGRQRTRNRQADDTNNSMHFDRLGARETLLYLSPACPLLADLDRFVFCLAASSALLLSCSPSEGEVER